MSDVGRDVRYLSPGDDGYRPVSPRSLTSKNQHRHHSVAAGNLELFVHPLDPVGGDGGAGFDLYRLELAQSLKS